MNVAFVRKSDKEGKGTSSLGSIDDVVKEEGQGRRRDVVVVGESCNQKQRLKTKSSKLRYMTTVTTKTDKNLSTRSAH